MKKLVKVALITLGMIVFLVLALGAFAYFYINSTFLNFEKEYDKQEMPRNQLSADGFTFIDRNNNGELDVYEDNRQDIDARINNLLSLMTLDEKIHLLKGSGMRSGMGMDPTGIPGAVGTIVPTPRLGIPTVYLSDGPAGLRIEPVRENDENTYYCTAFPIGTLLASTWNLDLVREVGVAMGTEASEYGIDVILGPGANIHRHPLCGRNFEYFSEDPVITGEIGAAMVNGIESQNIGTSVKHFVANNQETNRNFNDVIVSERAMREIYLKGFEIIVKKAQPWTIMSSYNKVNGTYVAENKYLLTEILRDDWRFDGIVMSDWFGGNDAVAMVNAGNDLLEPGTKRQWKALIEGAASGELTKKNTDTSVKRILKLVLNSQKMKGQVINNNPDLEKHATITRKSAAEGMVLLKNKQTLPMQSVNNIALIGVTSYEFIAGGTGSGDVNEAYTVSLEEGLTNAGYEINEIAKDAFERHKAAHPEEFIKPLGMKAMFTPYDPPEFALSVDSMELTASSADLAIITIGRNSGEGGDRVEKKDFLLTELEQNIIDQTCKAFHAADKEVVVVLNVGGVIETASWKSKPDAILLAWQGGQEGGNSVADILKGVVNPSGKLTMTFPIHLSDHASNINFPLDGDPINPMDLIFGDPEKPKEDQIKNKDFTKYDEGIYVGYRHFDKQNLETSYPFGYGLSYSNFEFTDLSASVDNDSIFIAATISNIGNYPGKEVAQLYVSMPESKVERPIQELKAFAKTDLLQAGASTKVKMVIAVHDLRYWDEDARTWTLEKGTYELRVGASSRDIRLEQKIEL